jgi:hypothetical protein
MGYDLLRNGLLLAIGNIGNRARTALGIPHHKAGKGDMSVILSSALERAIAETLVQ